MRLGFAPSLSECEFAYDEGVRKEINAFPLMQWLGFVCCEATVGQACGTLRLLRSHLSKGSHCSTSCATEEGAISKTPKPRSSA